MTPHPVLDVNDIPPDHRTCQILLFCPAVDSVKIVGLFRQSISIVFIILVFNYHHNGNNKYLPNRKKQQKDD